MSKFRKITYILLLGGFSIWVIAFAWVDLSYFSNLPKIPDEKTGRINRVIVSHGSVRYGSGREVRILKMIENFQPIAIVSFLVAVTLGLTSGDMKVAAGRKLDE